jgi:predicted HicB family RNase H-like nuclease
MAAPAGSRAVIHGLTAFRADPKLLEDASAAARARSITLSELMRRALRRELAEAA